MFLHVCKQTFRQIYEYITREFLGLKVGNSGYCFYLKTNFYGDFQTCRSVTLMYNVDKFKCKTNVNWIDNSYVIFIFLSQFSVFCKKWLSYLSHPISPNLHEKL